MFTPITLDKARNFRYGMKAISRLEKVFGKSISNIDLNGLTMEEVATLIWAGLVHEDAKLTPDKVMDLIDDHSNVAAVMEVASKAMGEAFGTGGETTEKNAPKVTRKNSVS